MNAKNKQGSEQTYHLVYRSPSIQGKNSTHFFIIKDGCIVSAATSVLFFCPAFLDDSLLESPKSDERRKIEVGEACIESSILLFDMRGSDTPVLVLSVCSCLRQVR